MAPDVVGALLGPVEVTAGESNVKAAFNVPLIKLTSAATLCITPDAAPVWQMRDVAADHEADVHGAPPTYTVLVISEVWKFKPVTVIIVRPLDGPLTNAESDMVGASYVNLTSAVASIPVPAVNRLDTDPVPAIVAPVLHNTVVDVVHDVVKHTTLLSNDVTVRSLL
jgi:hypothetical protein